MSIAISEVHEAPVSFRSSIVSAADIPAARPVRKLWLGLYPSSVTLLIGETDSGKTTLLYNLAVHAAASQPLLDIPFGKEEPLKVLYLDPENAGSHDGDGGLRSTRLDRLGQGRPANLIYHDARNLNLGREADLSAFRQYLIDEKIDLCILDPIESLFGERGEKGRVGAGRQMQVLVKLSRETGVCIVCCQRTGRATKSSYGRGASVRMDDADVTLHLRTSKNTEEIDDEYGRGNTGRSDTCRLQIIKNRIEGERGSLFLKMTGSDQFDRVDFTTWRESTGSPGPHDAETQAEAIEDKARRILSDGNWWLRTDLVEAMKRKGIRRALADQAINALQEAGAVTVRRDSAGNPVHLQLGIRMG